MAESGAQRVFQFTYPSQARLDNFVVCPGNIAAWSAIKDLTRGQGPGSVYVFGAAGVGKTHLLVGLARCLGEKARYIDLSGPRPDPLDPPTVRQVLALDHADVLRAGTDLYLRVWEAFNRQLYAGQRVVAAGRTTPELLPGLDAHLSSRFNSGLLIPVRPADDGSREQILLRWTRERSLPLGAKVIHYILRRAPRNVTELQRLLTRLDETALAEGRKVSVQLAKRILEAPGSGLP